MAGQSRQLWQSAPDQPSEAPQYGRFKCACRNDRSIRAPTIEPISPFTSASLCRSDRHVCFRVRLTGQMRRAPSQAAEQISAKPGGCRERMPQRRRMILPAARLLNWPGRQSECVWLGRRVVSLLWRDDLDTAFRHLDLYDRFGCPSTPYPDDISVAWFARATSVESERYAECTRARRSWINPTQAIRGGGAGCAAAQTPASQRQYSQVHSSW